MELLYKPDWEETKERYRRWWSGDYFGRCGLWVTAPKANHGAEAPPRQPDRIEDRWLDLDYLRAVNEYHLSTAFYGGEAFPIWSPGYSGWNSLGAFLGCSVTLHETTGWIDPLIADGDLTGHDYRRLVINPENPWWQKQLEILCVEAGEARGKSIPSTGAFGGSGDTLAALRTTNKLLYDVLDCPEYVREFDQYLMAQWCGVYDIFHAALRDVANGGSTGWFPLWAPGKFYAAQNDFSYMISPKTFREVFLPSVEMQTRFLDFTVYHVDGVEAFAHVPALCDLPRLQALQILPGAGKPSPLHYLETLKYVQSRSKNLHISIRANEVKDALDLLSARGLFITTSCASEAEAVELLKNCEKWSKDR